MVAGRPGASARARGRRMPRGMVVTAATIVAAGVTLSVVAGPLYGYTSRASADIHAARYVEIVLPEGIE